jgi:hypothetical protein
MWPVTEQCLHGQLHHGSFPDMLPVQPDVHQQDLQRDTLVLLQSGCNSTPILHVAFRHVLQAREAYLTLSVPQRRAAYDRKQSQAAAMAAAAAAAASAAAAGQEPDWIEVRPPRSMQQGMPHTPAWCWPSLPVTGQSLGHADCTMLAMPLLGMLAEAACCRRSPQCCMGPGWVG